MAGIFINYRRDDAPGVAGRLFDHLRPKFSRRSIFMDVDAMKPGKDFVKQLDTQVAQCGVLLAVIGPHWLDAKDRNGQRRLDSDNDYVRIELASALKRDIPVIPVLVDGAAMPPEDSLPDDLKSLARRHALELRHTRFDADAAAITNALEEFVALRRSHWRLIAVGTVAAAAVAAVIVFWPKLTAILRPAASPTAQSKHTTGLDQAPAGIQNPAPPAVPTQKPVSPPTAQSEHTTGLDQAPAGSQNPAPPTVPNQMPPTATVPLPTTPATPAPAPVQTLAPPPAAIRVPGPSEDLRVKLGDTVEQVKAAYGIKADVEGQILKAPLNGLTFWFHGKALHEVRADSPFAGGIEGVRIGDKADDLVTKLGQPEMARDLGFHNQKRFWFRFDYKTLMCDFDGTGKLTTMWYSAN
jgi:hypothetical protein